MNSVRKNTRPVLLSSRLSKPVMKVLKDLVIALYRLMDSPLDSGAISRGITNYP